VEMEREQGQGRRTQLGAIGLEVPIAGLSGRGWPSRDVERAIVGVRRTASVPSGAEQPKPADPGDAERAH
jgi:hypothetical protein